MTSGSWSTGPARAGAPRQAGRHQQRSGQRAALHLAFDWDVLEDSDHYPFIAARIPTLMLHTGLHDQYHRPSDDVELVNVGGIPLVCRPRSR